MHLCGGGCTTPTTLLQAESKTVNSKWNITGLNSVLFLLDWLHYQAKETSVPITTGRPHYLNSLKPLMASDSSSGFSPLWPRVFHISLQIRKAQPWWGRKEQTNKHGLGSPPSTRVRESLTLFVHSLSKRVLERKLSQSHLQCWLIYWLTCSVDWSLLLPSADCVLLLTDLSCRLSSSALLCRLISGTFLPSSFLSRERSRAQALCVDFTPKQRDRLIGTHRNGCHP